MVRISSMASGTLGVVSGAVSMALPITIDSFPLNPFATGTLMAVGVGTAACALWHKYGKSYFADYLARQTDAAIKDQRDSLKLLAAESVKSKLPAIIGSSAFIDGAVQSVVDGCVNSYTTDPEVVRNVLDDIDNHITYENNALLKDFVNQTTNSILDANCSGYLRPLRGFLKRPLDRIVATVAANCIKKSTETAVAKMKESAAAGAVISVENYLNCSLDGAIKQRFGL